MKTMFALTAIALVMMSVPVHAQGNGSYIAGTVINRTADIIQTHDANRTAVIINDRNAKVADHQIDSAERIEMEREKTRRLEIERQTEIENNRTAAEVYRTAAETGSSGSSSARNGQVSANVKWISQKDQAGPGRRF